MRDPYDGGDIPWLAKDWTVETWDNGGTTATKLTFNLYENIKWSDGTPLTSADVAFTMKYMYDTAATYYANVESIDGIDTETPHIETPDANTVIIYYSVETVWAMEMTGVVPIIPKHVWETIPPEFVEEQGEFMTTGNLTCSGPYLIDNHLEGEWWLLRTNPYFFRSLFCDVNYDGSVDMADISIMIDWFMTSPPNWDPNCDVNNDNTIDMADISIAIDNFMKASP